MTSAAWLLLAPALAATARFDGPAEGETATLVTDDGVVLDQLDVRVDGGPSVFTIEDASGTLAGLPGFSPPNALGFGGYVPGEGAAFGRFGEVRIHGPSPADRGVVEVFQLGNDGVVLRLEAWRGGAVVATDEVVLAGWVTSHHTLTVAAPGFDHLRLSAGDSPDDAAFLLVDDVRLDLRDEPEVAPGDTGLPADADPAEDPPAPVAEDTAAPSAAPVAAGLPQATVSGPDGCGCVASGAAPSGALGLLLGLGAVARRRRR